MFLVLKLCNQVLDFPYLPMGYDPTAVGQKKGAVLVEIFIGAITTNFTGG
jgi:hypothetical protein